ncbi:hypothetical protein E2C01_071433 [Portunus trituberculatus]|uniref:Uncharacterized protein n=1 Tax=Portunus trituberculatus TaxID=210409 RepID=A0A5B7I4Y0_PORTR|nr:hypothetical protein [Portunus trituberculatus]
MAAVQVANTTARHELAPIQRLAVKAGQAVTSTTKNSVDSLQRVTVKTCQTVTSAVRHTVAYTCIGESLSPSDACVTGLQYWHAPQCTGWLTNKV